jgi:hypothetical protein
MPWAGLTAAAIIGRCQLFLICAVPPPPPPPRPPSCHIVALSFSPCTHFCFCASARPSDLSDLLTFSVNHLASFICVRQTLWNMVCPRPVLAVVADRVLAGETLLTWLPRDTHDDLYSIMRSTWSRDPRQRPLMSEVLSRLQDLETKLLQVGHLTWVLLSGFFIVGYGSTLCRPLLWGRRCYCCLAWVCRPLLFASIHVQGVPASASR